MQAVANDYSPDMIKTIYDGFEQDIKEKDIRSSQVLIGALYIRVSTDKQEELSPDAQLRLGLDYAKKNNIIIPKDYIFIENGISGRRAEKRPQFQRMIAIAKSKEHPIDIILVWKFSRFARNQEESILYKSLLKKNNVDVVSISEPLIDGPFGTLIERIIEWMDEYYSIRLAGEVTKGMTEKALRGGYQAKPPLGYKIEHPKEPPVIVPEEAEIVKLIFNKYVYEGMSFFQIAHYLNDLGFKTERGKKFERRAIEYIIQNPTYVGKIRWNRKESATNIIKPKDEWIIRDGNHEPIISKELFELAQNRYNSEYTPKKSRPSAEYKHWLSGIIKCSNCGCSLTASKVPHSRYLHFRCNGYSKGKCNTPNSISENIIIPKILKAIENVISTGNIEYSIPKLENNNELSLYEQQLAKLSGKELRIKEAYINGIDTLEEYKSNKEMINRERISLLEKIEKIKSSSNDEHKQEMLKRVKNVYDIITKDDVDNVTKNKAMKSVIEKIVFNKSEGNIDIFFYYA